MKKTIRFEENDKSVTAYLSGIIDSSSAPQVEEELMLQKQDCPLKEVDINAEGLTYISSAGLRVLLKLRKMQNELKIFNVSAEVYEVLEMTGFTKILSVSKLLRKVSVEGCPLLGRGGHGSVYRIDDETIVKVFEDKSTLEMIDREREFSRKAFIYDIPTAIPFDVVKCGEQLGVVYELINARSLAETINLEPQNLERYAEKYAKVFKQINSVETTDEDGFINVKDAYCGIAEKLNFLFNTEEILILCKIISAVPERRTLIHGDFHPQNILVQNEELILIDMGTLSYGHPIFDLAAVYLVMVFSGKEHEETIQRILGMGYDQSLHIWNHMIKTYFETEDSIELEQINKVIAAFSFVKLALSPAQQTNNMNDAMTKQLAAIVRERLLPNADGIIHMLNNLWF